VAAAAAFGAGTPRLTHRKVAAAFAPNSAKRRFDPTVSHSRSA